MPECSNPIQCQLAKRAFCSCACNGANHGALRKYLDSPAPEERQEGLNLLKTLQEEQAKLKTQKRKERRQRRAAAKQVQKQEA